MDALEYLTPLEPDYARLPVADAFDWGPAAAALGDGEWYMVVFRSIRRAGADEQMLTDYDDRAANEAIGSDGYVHYFKGPLATDGSCLSFCIWQSRAHARLAAAKPQHAEAVSLTGVMYERYVLEFLRVMRVDGGPLTFEPYDAPPAGVTGESAAAA